MSVIDLVTIRLNWAEVVVVQPAPHLLRGALAARFPEDPLLHQHEGERNLYRYPQVQYRWDEEGPIVLGLGEGARVLATVAWAGLQLQLGEQVLTVRDAVCHFRRHEIRPASRLLRFAFLTPWLPFSQKNYLRYQTLSPAEQAGERDRLAVAGVLTALRGCGVNFPEQLYAAVEVTSSLPCPYKEVSLLGFQGNLVANVDLPDGFAIGRATSHGYGWLCPISAPSARGILR